MTMQRKVILEAVKAVKTHPTADEIYALVKPKLPGISLGTVYRNLEYLSRNGFIAKMNPAEQQMRFDGTIEPHFHVRCLGCGRLEDLPIVQEGDVEDVFPGLWEAGITGYKLEFIWLCPGCLNNLSLEDELAAERNFTVIGYPAGGGGEKA